MSDPYAETDEWPTPAPQQSASGSTVTGDAEGAREARYAEAIHEAQYGCGCGHPNSRDRKSARAVMAVADEEQAALRAEVERLRMGDEDWHYVAQCAEQQFETELRDAEARLRKVAELGKEWQQSEDRAWVSSLGDDVMDVLTQQSARLAVLAALPAAPEAAETTGEAHRLVDHIRCSCGAQFANEGSALAHVLVDNAPVSSGEVATGEASRWLPSEDCSVCHGEDVQCSACRPAPSAEEPAKDGAP